jgi:hypothetical protein
MWKLNHISITANAKQFAINRPAGLTIPVADNVLSSTAGTNVEHSLSWRPRSLPVRRSLPE